MSIAKTINSSCENSFNAIKLLLQERDKCGEIYNSTMLELQAYVKNNPNAKPEEVITQFTDLETNYMKYGLFQMSVNEEANRFEVLYTLSLQTETPFEADKQDVENFLKNDGMMYASDGSKVVCLKPEEEKTMLDKIKAEMNKKEKLQHEINKIKSIVQKPTQ